MGELLFTIVRVKCVSAVTKTLYSVVSIIEKKKNKD